MGRRKVAVLRNVRHGGRRPARPPARGQSSATDAEQFHVELQRGVRGDHAARAARAVAQGRGDDERALAADLHALHAFVPALDHHAGAEVELERGIAVAAGVELRALLAVVVEPAGVVHAHRLAAGGLGAFADGGVFVLQAGRGGGECHGGTTPGWW